MKAIPFSKRLYSLRQKVATMHKYESRLYPPPVAVLKLNHPASMNKILFSEYADTEATSKANLPFYQNIGNPLSLMSQTLSAGTHNF